MTGGPVLTSAQMRAAEQAAFDAGVDDYATMERAGAAVAEIVWRAGHRRDALILCGPGNNGGDGFVVARLLRERGVPVRVAILDESRTSSSERARTAWDGPVEDMMTVRPAVQLVDALFGIGLTRGLEAQVAARFGELASAATASYAIDVPSGVDADYGALLSAVPHFGTCIALGAYKPAHFLHPAAACFDRLVLADIGIPLSSPVNRLTPPVIETPEAGAYKYSRGLVAVIGGAMPGAAALAAASAAHACAGMVRLFVDEASAHPPHAIVRQTGTDLSDRRIRALLVGPGLGRDAKAERWLAKSLATDIPMVMDADALVLLAGRMERVPSGSILTPHEGEFRRMFGELPGSKIDRALAAARSSGGIIVYKGADSVIAAPDGRAAVARGATPWLSTAGTGDVLAGIAAGRLAVTGDPFRAACEAVWLHGEAARRAGPAFIADDLLGTLPEAIAARL